MTISPKNENPATLKIFIMTNKSKVSMKKTPRQFHGPL